MGSWFRTDCGMLVSQVPAKPAVLGKWSDCHLSCSASSRMGHFLPIVDEPCALTCELSIYSSPSQTVPWIEHYFSLRWHVILERGLNGKTGEKGEDILWIIKAQTLVSESLSFKSLLCPPWLCDLAFVIVSLILSVRWIASWHLLLLVTVRARSGLTSSNITHNQHRAYASCHHDHWRLKHAFCFWDFTNLLNKFPEKLEDKNKQTNKKGVVLSGLVMGYKLSPCLSSFQL